jgi:DNA polymerase III subunit epsilon
MNYAIIDIETTGLSPRYDRITEVAILIHDGQKVTNRFISLINPEKKIPFRIREMTGISDAMVAEAPRFCEVARQILEITEGCVFVAHNATFDYSFIKAEFARLGYNYERQTLCTRNLSQKLMPGMRSYSLGNLCNNLNITILNRHRAFGDAEATTLLFDHLLSFTPNPESIPLRGIRSHVHHDTLAKLPLEPGVYYLHNETGDIIYIGKSINIRDRVLTHLSNSASKRAAEMRDQVYDVTFEVCGSELVALLLEAQEVKTHMPRFNRLLRRQMLQWGLYLSYSTDGYALLDIRKNTQDSHPLTTFSSKKAATEFLFYVTEKHTLCQKLCGLYKTKGACFHHQIRQCYGACIGEEPPEDYNARVSEAIEPYTFIHDSFILIDKGRHPDEKSVVLVENRSYCGYGYLNTNEAILDPSHLKMFIRSAPDHRDAQQIIRTFIKQGKPERIIRIHREPTTIA